MSVFGAVLLTLASNGLLTASIGAQPQRRIDLSGKWILVEALASGPTRDGADGSSRGPRRTTSTTVSGAPFNCGRGCSIEQKDQTLVVADAQLADYPGKDKSQATPAVTFHLDGRDDEVVDSFSPGRRLPARARWEGASLRIESRQAGSRLGTTQVLSLDGGQLVVVSEVTAGGAVLGATTAKYQKAQ